MADLNWKANPGKSAKPRDPEKKVWLQFRNGWETKEPVRAGNYIWLHRGDNPGDIMFAAEVEKEKPRAAAAPTAAPATPSPIISKDGPVPISSPSSQPPSEQGSLL